MSYYNGMSRAEAAEEAGFVWDRRTRQYIDPSDYCNQCGCELDECESNGECERETTTSKTVTARKARNPDSLWNEIRPGDRVTVTSGFTYLPGGPRVSYLGRTYRRLSKGPAWDNDAVNPAIPIKENR